MIYWVNYFLDIQTFLNYNDAGKISTYQCNTNILCKWRVLWRHFHYQSMFANLKFIIYFCGQKKKIVLKNTKFSNSSRIFVFHKRFFFFVNRPMILAEIPKCLAKVAQYKLFNLFNFYFFIFLLHDILEDRH